jgi:plasmid stabilization system protein ParE
MKAEVVFARDFRNDLNSQTRRLVAEAKEEWAERLIHEIEMAAALLGNIPLAGAVETHRGKSEIRRLVLRGLPFVVWYSFQARQRKVLVMRLFHVRQSRAKKQRPAPQ